MPPEAGLKLRAEDPDDLTVISACLQDALVPVRDLAYDRATQTFMLVANRFRWECSGQPATDDGFYERVLCGVSFGGVESVAYRGFRRSEEARILSLLAIRPAHEAASSTNGVTIDLDFAGDSTIRLNATTIRCVASDLGEPWPTTWHPDHPPDDPEEAR